MNINECFEKFLKRTRLDAAYDDLKKRYNITDDIRELTGDHLLDDTYKAIHDAFEASEEYKAYEEYCKADQLRKWNEAEKASVRGKFASDCIIYYSAGTNGYHKFHPDTKTVCAINGDASDINFYKENKETNTLKICASGNAELQGLIDTFRGLADILEKQKNKSEKPEDQITYS